jgi:hypothetical protein
MRVVSISQLKSHTHCLAAPATHIQSQSKSVLGVVLVEKVVNEKSPTAPQLRKIAINYRVTGIQATNEVGRMTLRLATKCQPRRTVANVGFAS